MLTYIDNREIDRAKYKGDPFVALSFGAGVQSTALLMLTLTRDARLLHAMEGQLPTCAIFADPGAESKQTYDHVLGMQELCAEQGFPLYRVSAGDLGQDIFKAKRFASIPAFTRAADGSKGMLRRQCTREYKIAPIYKKIRELIGLKPRQRMDRPVHQWIGISLDEVVRAKPARKPWCRKVFPLIQMGWRRSDCLLYLRSMGLEQVGKSACVFCPYHDDRTWLEMKRSDPEAWEQACSMDEALRNLHVDGRGGIENPLYLHRSCVSLRHAELGEDQGNLFEGWDNECEGMCGL